MKNKINNLLIVLTILFLFLGFQSSPTMAAGSCQNTECEDLNPYTMGCPASTSGPVKVLPDAYSTVETRKSGENDCDAKWARTYNYSGAYRYAAASLRYGGANYGYSKNVSSPGTISSGSTVYTPMHAYAFTPTRSCGKVLQSGPISVPISLSDTYCTGAN